MLVPPEGFDDSNRGGDDIAWINQVMMDVSMPSILRPGILALCQGPTMSNPNAMKMMERDTIFTNVALPMMAMLVGGDGWRGA